MADNESQKRPFVGALITVLVALTVIGTGIVTGWLIGDSRGAFFGGVLATAMFLGVFAEVALGWVCDAALRLIQPAAKALNRKGLNPELETLSPRLRRWISIAVLVSGIGVFVLIVQKW